MICQKKVGISRRASPNKQMNTIFIQLRTFPSLCHQLNSNILVPSRKSAITITVHVNVLKCHNHILSQNVSLAISIIVRVSFFVHYFKLIEKISIIQIWHWDLEIKQRFTLLFVVSHWKLRRKGEYDSKTFLVQLKSIEPYSLPLSKGKTVLQFILQPTGAFEQELTI